MASQYNTSILAQPLFKKQLLNKALQANPYGTIYKIRDIADLPSSNPIIPQSAPFVRFSGKGLSKKKNHKKKK